MGFVNRITFAQGFDDLNANLASISGSLQNDVDSKIPLSYMAAVNGVATLDANGRLSDSQIPASILGATIYRGTWDAGPGILPSGVAGDYYIIEASGIMNGDLYLPGDWAIYNGVHWDKIDNNDQVISVNGQQGVISIGINDLDDTEITTLNNRQILQYDSTKWINTSTPTLDSITLNTSASGIISTKGKLFWDDEDNTAALGLGDNVSLQIGQEQYIRAVNKTGITIPNGSVVRIEGAQGNRPKIVLSQANTESCNTTIGLTTHDIDDNHTGFVTVFGLVRDVDTGSYNEGDILYLSPTIAGGYTNVQPSAPNYSIIIGQVITANNNNGIIAVHIDKGLHLVDLHDVNGTVPLDKYILQFIQASGYWDSIHINDAIPTSSIVESKLSISDNTINDTSTSAHGLAPKAVAPAAGILNVYGIANGETSITNKAIFDNTNPAAIGTVSSGSSLIAARRDHVHAADHTALTSIGTNTHAQIDSFISNAASTYAPIASGVLNGNAHDHIGGDGAAIVEGAITLADNTTNDASTSKHGFVVKATAPAVGLMNIVGIGNAETAYTNKALFDATLPAAIGTSATGTALVAARRDHVHAADHTSLTSIGTNTHAQIDTFIGTTAPATYAPIAKGVTNGDSHDHNGGDGAAIVEAAITLADNTTNNASTSKHGFVVKATAPASGLINFVGIGNGETAYTNKALFDSTTPAAIGSAAAGTSTIAARRDHVHAAAHSNLSNLLWSTAGHTLDTTLVMVASASLAPQRITASATAPSSPTTEDVYLDTGANTGSTQAGFRRYNGSSWVDLNSGGIPVIGASTTNAAVKWNGITGNAVADSSLIIEDGPVGGTVWNLIPYSSDPATVENGDIWLIDTGSGSAGAGRYFIKAKMNNVVLSVELS